MNAYRFAELPSNSSVPSVLTLLVSGWCMVGCRVSPPGGPSDIRTGGMPSRGAPGQYPACPWLVAEGTTRDDHRGRPTADVRPRLTVEGHRVADVRLATLTVEGRRSADVRLAILTVEAHRSADVRPAMITVEARRSEAQTL